MRSDADQRSVAGTGAYPGDIAFRVNLQVRQAVGLCHGPEGPGASRFLEGRRRDLGQRDDVLYRAVMLGCESRRGFAIGFARHDLADHRLGLIGHGMRAPASSGRVLAEDAAMGKPNGGARWTWPHVCNGNCRRCRDGWESR